jgi:TPR repeat protein
MACVLCGPFKWLSDKLAAAIEAPACDELNQYFSDWDYAHANDQAMDAAETNWDRVREAYSLQDSDPEQAFDMFLALAEQGSVRGMIYVGWQYDNVRADTRKAEYWYRRAFEVGSEHALLSLAQLLYQRGAFDLYEDVCRASAENGWAPAMHRLAHVRLKRAKDRRTLSEVRDLLERAAQQNCPGAQYLLAQLLMRGRFGLREISRGTDLAVALRKRMSMEAGGDVVGLARSS